MYSSFETERLLFVPLSLDHLAGYHVICSDELVSRYGLQGAFKTIDQSKDHLLKISTTPENPDVVNYALFLRSPLDTDDISKSHPIGVLGCHLVIPEKKAALLSYRFLPVYWGKGYASEALKAFLPVFWDLHPEVEKIEAIVDRENVPSQKILVKNGFRSIEHDIAGGVLPLIGPEVRAPPFIFQIQRNFKEGEDQPKWVLWFRAGS
ncbi:GNAT domain-containing protein [Flagelloscypha sp. PMI_526]|nr:GNAT domain-containing protein [Flagelloscypha sp. PMI_526]